MADQARPRAVNAAREIVKQYGIRGLSDPGYIANVIERELRRFDLDPDSPLIEHTWRGPDSTTGMTVDELSHFAVLGSQDRAAQAASISIVRDYPSAILKCKFKLEWALRHIAQVIGGALDHDEKPPAKPHALTESELDFINRHRATIYQAPLDPVGSGWGPDDITAEYKRIRALNPEMSGLATMVSLQPDEVFAKVTSHRGFQSVVSRLGGKPQTYVSLRRRTPSATYHFIVSPDQFEQIRKISGVGRARFRQQDEWFEPISFNPRGANPLDAIKAELLSY